MIVLHNVKKQYVDQLLFEEVTFNVNPGERIGLLGRNGHGKTTLLRVMAGIDKPDRARSIMTVRT